MRNKNIEFWKRLKDWDISMAETWMGEKEWKKTKRMLPKEYI